jgi:formylglycine-generating enzyme required for sulfatase activity
VMRLILIGGTPLWSIFVLALGSCHQQVGSTTSATSVSPDSGAEHIDAGCVLGILSSPHTTAPPGMAVIPGGSFMLGTNTQACTHVAPFFLDITEVTVSNYRTCMTEGRCTAPDDCCGGCDFAHALPDAPAECVNWSQALAYCSWRQKRLPTEEEWEFGARGVDGRLYPWGNELPTPSHVCTKHDQSRLLQGHVPARVACPVGSFPLGNSPFGVSDMSGNVAEWTATSFPHGLDGGEPWRVVRGGAYLGSTRPEDLTVTSRLGMPEFAGKGGVGFRCAMSLGTQP